mmetsp:Transcript_781/g.2265  ORF Transcript_781/g.2265 Transcript_781/m.2265 type:complete len:201 (+) Transcript_781:939-1541(+)
MFFTGHLCGQKDVLLGGVLHPLLPKVDPLQSVMHRCSVQEEGSVHRDGINYAPHDARHDGEGGLLGEDSVVEKVQTHVCGSVEGHRPRGHGGRACPVDGFCEAKGFEAEVGCGGEREVREGHKGGEEGIFIASSFSSGGRRSFTRPILILRVVDFSFLVLILASAFLSEILANLPPILRPVSPKVQPPRRGDALQIGRVV